MKKLLIIIPLFFFPVVSFALDGEVYFGQFFDSNMRASPDGGTAKWISGIELGHKMDVKIILRPYLKLETYMDKWHGDSFHPSSIKYDVGINAELYKGIYIDILRSCWHPIDRWGKVEQYYLLKMGWKFGKQ